MTMTLRPPEVNDALQVFVWRNTPWIIALGSSQRPVSWREHQAWFRRVRTEPTQHLLWMVSVEGLNAGIVRLDRVNPTQATVTIYLMREYTGKGLGVQALRGACRRGFDQWPIDTMIASIRADNRPSLSAFAKAGFVPTGTNTDGHCEMALHAVGPNGLLQSYETVLD